MDAGAAWFLNLDAELELAARGSYRPTRAVAAFVREHRRRVRRLLAPGEALVEEGVALPGGRAWVGRAWCPTPRALAALRSAGARPAPAPGLDVLRRANERAFRERLGETLPGAGFARSAAELRDRLRERPPGATWLLKRAFGFAGRARRLVGLERWTAEDDAWVARALAQGALRVEPRVAIVRELGTHGLVPRAGDVRVAPSCAQVCGPDGAWLESRTAGAEDLDAAARAELERRAREAGEALRELGYHGPFGADAYVWRDAGGAERLNPLGELNARYTMGWGLSRAALEPLEDA